MERERPVRNKRPPWSEDTVNSIRSARRGEPSRERRSLRHGDRLPSRIAEHPREAGRALMVGDGMAGRPSEVIRETGGGPKTVFMPLAGRRAATAGVRASVVARKRVTTVERRERRKVEAR